MFFHLLIASLMAMLVLGFHQKGRDLLDKAVPRRVDKALTKVTAVTLFGYVLRPITLPFLAIIGAGWGLSKLINKLVKTKQEKKRA